MASYLDKFKIKTAIEKNTALDLSCQHITTADWLQLNPVYVKEMVPGEKIDIKMSTFTRLAPMAVPTLGRGLIHNRAFFVPMRTIYSRWDDFITRAPGVSVTQQAGSTTSYMSSRVPCFDNIALVNAFLSDHFGAGTLTPSTTGRMLKWLGSGLTLSDIEKADVALRVVDESTAEEVWYYFNYTAFGREIYKMLTALGYNIVWTTFKHLTNDVSNMGASSAALAKVTDMTYSALPLKAFVKLYLDWYWPSQYVGSAAANVLRSFCDYTENTNDFAKYQNTALANVFNYLSNNNLRGVVVNYDSDYFVSAFDTADGPETRNTGTLSLPNIDITPTDAQTISNSGGTPGTSNNAAISGSSGVITQYGLNALRALTDYLKRHQLVGSRAIDRFYARFGINLGSEKLKRSNYIGAMNVPLQFGDVMSHTDSSENSPLGAYAGKGIGYGENGFSFTAEEYGYIVICSSLVPQIGYYQGIDRNVLHVSPLDFYTPEFDQLGNQAISRAEVYIPGNITRFGGTNIANAEQIQGQMANAAIGKGIFGYTPRYAEYKIGHDRLTGDFRINSLSQVGDTDDAWHLMRNLDGRWQSADDIVHDYTFVQGLDGNQYNRIFYNTEDTADKFYLIHNFNVISNSPMHSLYDTYDFESDGKETVVDVNGVKVN